MGAEQFAGDSYHADSLHKFVFDLGYLAKNRASGSGINVPLPRGHSVRLLDLRAACGDRSVAQFMRERPPLGLSSSLVDEVVETLSPEQLELVGVTPPLVGNVFPNFSFIQFPGPDAAGRLEGGAVSVRVFNPVGAGKTEVISWTIVERDAPEEVRKCIESATTQTFSISGVFEQDDAEAWLSTVRVVRGPQGRRQWLDYRSTSAGRSPDVVGQGVVGSSDDLQWNFLGRLA